MSYLEFDKSQLINLEYSLSREFLRTNRAGSFASTTIVNCHTRKYHGLLISPIENLDCGWHVLLSALDETIVQHQQEFHLAVRRYPGIFHPGHKYIREFSTEPIPSITYRIGGVILKKEMLLAEEEETILVRYTLVDANSPTTIKLHPFLAFRNIHSLCKANMDVNTKYTEIKNGISTRMYDSYPMLNMQLSGGGEYVSAPDWFYNVEYSKELERGYDGHEDLFVPGYFEIDIKKGEEIIFAASLSEQDPKTLKRKFADELKKRTPRNSFENCLENAAQQFFLKQGNQTEIVASYPFLDQQPRKTFIALPGLTLSLGKVRECKDVLDTMTARLQANSFSFNSTCQQPIHNSADTALWYIWAIQQYARHADAKSVWKAYGKSIRQVFDAIKQNSNPDIQLHDNGLIHINNTQTPLTWMDSVAYSTTVVQRYGYTIDINALWYNAVCFVVDIAKEAKSNKFVAEWRDYPEQVRESFVSTFWCSKKQYLADYSWQGIRNMDIRPNQILAVSLPHSPLDMEMQKAVLDLTKSDLLTPHGLRTLSPKNERYIGFCEGNINERNKAIHQGMAWPWLLGHYVEAYLRLHEKGGLNSVKRLYKDFEPEISKHGIGTISEMYEGNPPFGAKGAISQASSVAALLRIKELIDQYEKA